MVKVNRRGGFSDRHGIKVENTEIQLKDLDNRTRIQIFNLLSEQYNFIYRDSEYWEEPIQRFFRYINSEVFCRKVDVRKRIDDDEFFDEINQVIINNSYDDVLTLVEAISEYWEEDGAYDRRGLPDPEGAGDAHAGGGQYQFRQYVRAS